jgi:hypothetical protein
MPPKRKKPVPENLRTRCEPPTLDEAIFAAQGLAPDIEGQTEIAAMLMGMPQAEVRPSVLKAAATAARALNLGPVPVRPSSGMPIVVVKRRSSRVVIK